MHNPLITSPTKPSGGVFKIVSHLPGHPLSENDPALELMRDFTRTGPLTLRSGLGVQEATDLLYSSGVAFAVVTNPRVEILGLLSLKNLVGPRPMSIASQRGVALTDIEVRDVMHALSNIPVITWHQVRGLKVKELVELFKETHSKYLLVADESDQETRERTVLGLFSADEVSHRLGVPLNGYSVPESFAEIVHAVRGQSG